MKMHISCVVTVQLSDQHLFFFFLGGGVSLQRKSVPELGMIDPMIRSAYRKQSQKGKKTINLILVTKIYQPVNIIQLFHACLVNSQNYDTRCRGQLNALLPGAARPRAIVH